MRITLLIVLVLFGMPTLQSQTKLGKAKKSLSSKSNTASGNGGVYTSTASNSSSYDDNDSGFLTNLILELGWPVLKLAAVVPYSLAIESPWEREELGHNALLMSYAFANGNKGLYTYEEDPNSKKFTITISDRFVYENSTIQGNHFNVNARFWKRFGLEADHLLLWENNPNFGKDQLSMFSVLAKYYRVRTERFTGWWGVGFNYIGSGVNETGFAYGLGVEAFIAKPISLEATFNGSWINQEHVSRFNAGVNYHIKNIKLSGGYEYLQVGDPKFSLFSAGVGITF